MKIQLTILVALLICIQPSRAQERVESDETHCARTISSISAILGQLKNNPAVRNEQIAAAIDGHTSDPALRAFIRSDIAPRIFSQDKKSAETYLGSRLAQDRCIQALNSYVVLHGN